MQHTDHAHPRLGVAPHRRVGLEAVGPTSPEGLTPVRIGEVRREYLKALAADLRGFDFPPMTRAGEEAGIPQDRLEELRDAWLDYLQGGGWAATHARLNDLEQYHIEVDGLSFHVALRRSPHAGARPLLFTNGYPAGFVWADELSQMLAHPTEYGCQAADAFHVVMISLPGYGLTDAPPKPGWDIDKIASAYRAIARALGFTRCALAGGDWGAILNEALCLQDPDAVLGLHTTMPYGLMTWLGMSPEQQEAEKAAASRFGKRALRRTEEYMAGGSAYATLLTTRPMTAGWMLAAHPMSMAAWHTMLIDEWSDPESNPEHESRLTTDEIAALLTWQWLTNCASSMGWMYRGTPRPSSDPLPPGIPVAVTYYKYGVVQFTQGVLEQRMNIRSYEEVDHGGHFPEKETPAEYAQAIAEGLRGLT